MLAGVICCGCFLSTLLKVYEENKEGIVGEKIVYDFLSAVIRHIAENAGFDGELVLANCYNKHLGFNALTGYYEDLVKTGVINAVKIDK